MAATFQLLRIAVLALSLALVQTQPVQTPPAQTTPAQTPGTQPAETQAPPDIVFHTTTRLVQVNVVVHDRDGKPVGDLKKEDFSLTEKGKPQEISFFSVESLDKLPAPPPKLPPHIFSNQMAEREGVPNSVTVILLDSLNTGPIDQSYARKAVIDFLLQLKPTDHIAIYRLSSTLQVLHDYTTDSAELIKRLQESQTEMLPGSDGTGFDLSPILGMSGRQAALIMNDHILQTLSVMEAIANHLAGVPGRKNLVWVSDGIPLAIGSVMGRPSQEQRTYSSEVQETERALNDADVSVYAVDARGLTPPRGFSAASNSPKMGSGGGSTNSRGTAPRGGGGGQPISTRFDSMVELSDRTGGKAYHNTNDLKGAIREAIGDSEITYTLGYHPNNTEMDGKFREIKVKVDRSGVNVRYRKGYMALAGASQDPKVSQGELANAVWSPLDATALGVNARLDFLDKPEPNTVKVIVQVHAAGLNLEMKDGRYTGKVEVLLVQKDDRGNQVGHVNNDTLSLNLKPETYAKTLQQGLLYQKAFAREANASTLRVVVRDSSTGATGSLTIAYKDIN